MECKAIYRGINMKEVRIYKLVCVLPQEDYSEELLKLVQLQCDISDIGVMVLFIQEE